MASTQRNVQLSKRDAFLSDPFFSDILGESDDLFQKKLSCFKDGTALAVRSDTAHNLQVSASNDQFLIQLELPGFRPDDFSLKTRDDVVVLEANHNSGQDDVTTSRQYYKEFNLPQGTMRDQISSAYTSEGVLTISAPRKIDVPEGAELSESMTAASKAFTTDDGTKVAQDSQASSQMIATSTKSDDGSSASSSMSFSSSSFSSSSTTSSSDTSGGGIPSLGMDMPKMAMPNMDDMMKNMMNKMSLDGPTGGNNTSKKMSSSSMSSSSSSMSSSSSTTKSSSDLMQSGIPSLRMQMPSMPGFGIEEMSTAGTDVSCPPYTVTSPPPTSSGEMEHKVSPAKGYVPSNTADATVLLKLKQGQEYKLVLNMQQYKPENIVVKLNDRILSITAEDGMIEKFHQQHTVPSGINLDQLTSSFSSDGILVIKAPKM